jgi:hypothetical protein
MLIYDITVYRRAKATGDCDKLVSSLSLNEVLWFVTRSVQTYLWIIPAIYIFWPRILLKRPKLSSDIFNLSQYSAQAFLENNHSSTNVASSQSGG